MSRTLAAWDTLPGPGRTDWRHSAACLGADAETWFPIGSTGPARQQIEAAIAVCSTCPVRTACLQYALDHRIDDGVWGGMSEDERRAYKRRSNRARATGAPLPDPVVLPGTLPAEATAHVVGAYRDDRKSWREIAKLLGTSESTCREVHAGTRPRVARAIEENARRLAARLVDA